MSLPTGGTSLLQRPDTALFNSGGDDDDNSDDDGDISRGLLHTSPHRQPDGWPFVSDEHPRSHAQHLLGRPLRLPLTLHLQRVVDHAARGAQPQPHERHPSLRSPNHTGRGPEPVRQSRQLLV